jgi:hypothetical protein
MMQKEDLARIKEDRGPNDLDLQIDMLKKQKEYLQKQCRKAGEAILNQELKFDALSKEYDKVVEENNNLKTIAKREYAGRLLGDPVRSKDFNTWTRDELTHYLATVIEGDGGIQVLSALTGNSKSCIMTISSNDKHYLASLVSISASRLNIISRFKKITRSYETKRGPVHMYKLYLQCSRRNTENLDFLKSLLQYNVMTLDRKKEKVQEFLTWMALNTKPNLKIESRV